MPEESKKGVRTRSTLRNYVLIQVPGAIFVFLLLAGLHQWKWVTLPIAALCMLAWVVKDALMYRVVAESYGPGPPHGTDALIGTRGIVAHDLAPMGSVRLGAEHWSARVAEGVGSLSRGASVRVTAVEGFVIVVVPSETEPERKRSASRSDPSINES